MRGLVHTTIVESAVTLLPPDLRTYLNMRIEQGEHAGKKRIDLLKLGAEIEDDVDNPGILPNSDPELDKEIEAIVKIDGPHWPHLEHFWNNALNPPNEGLVVTASGLGKLAANLALDPFLGETLGEIVGHEIPIQTFHSALDRARRYWQYYVIHQFNENNIEFALINLGRVLHLLADVGTPAHVHGDIHVGISTYDDDDYEEYTHDTIEALGNRLPYGWCELNKNIIYNPNWTWEDYFFKLGEISRLYDSDDYDGLGKHHPYHWLHWWESIKNIFPCFDRDPAGDLTDHACNAIASDLIPLTIQLTAGLICEFFKSVGWYIALDTIVVEIHALHVYEDTDPTGSGEIYLRANLGTQKYDYDRESLIQIGDEFDIGSGMGKPLFYDLNIAIQDTQTPLYFKAWAYDDDSNYFNDNDWESLGDISYIIDPSILDPAKPLALRIDSNADEGQFGLDVVIKLLPRNQFVADFSGIMNKISHHVQGEVLHETKYNWKKNPPIFLNLKTMAVHGLADGDTRYCKKWSGLDKNIRLEIFMTKDELFKEIDGKTQLQKIVDMRFGENSKQSSMVANIKDFKGHCSCLNVGWQKKRTP